MTAAGLTFGLGNQAAYDAMLALGTPKLMLLASTYTPNQDTDQYISGISADEIASGGGYTTGGLDMSAATTSYDAANNRAAVTLPTVSGLSVTCQWAVLYIDTGTTTTSPVWAYWDLSEGAATDVSVSGIAWDASGSAYTDAA